MNDFDLPEVGFGGSFNEFGYIPARAENRFCAGLDLGKQIDSSTIVILRKERLPLPVIPNDSENSARSLDADLRQRLGEPKIYVEHAERLPLGLSFVMQAHLIKAIMNRYNKICPNLEIVADRTGVGMGLLDILTSIGLHAIRVCITSGRKVNEEDDGYTVPKMEIMTAVMAAFNNAQLVIAGPDRDGKGGLPDFKELMKQLAGMQLQFTAGGSLTANGATGFHDDYTTSIGLALWRLNPTLTGHRFTVNDLSDYIS